MLFDYFVGKSLDWIKLVRDSPAARLDTRIKRHFPHTEGDVTNSTTVSLQRKAALSEDVRYSQCV